MPSQAFAFKDVEEVALCHESAPRNLSGNRVARHVTWSIHVYYVVPVLHGCEEDILVSVSRCSNLSKSDVQQPLNRKGRGSTNVYKSPQSSERRLGYSRSRRFAPISGSAIS